MKKTLLLKTMLLLCALVVGSLNGWADADVDYSFSSFTSAATVTLTPNDDITITLAKNNGSSNPAWTSDQARVYAKGSLTVASKAKRIATIVYTYVVNANKNGVTPTIDGVTGKEADGTWNSTTKTWTGSATEVTFATSGTAGNVGFTKIEITYEAEPEVSSLSVKTPPTKVRYEVGETLDMSGFVLDADGNEVSTGYTMTVGETAIQNGATLNTPGKMTITVSYGGKTVEQIISVGAVTSISVTTPPAKTTYETGDSFDPTGMVVTASLSTGELESPDTWTKEVTGYTIDPEDDLASSNTYVTITYATKTTTQTITVTNVAVTGVTLSPTASVKVGKTIELVATVSPANATNKNVTWESGNEAIATVTSAGVVSGVATGTTTITVTTEEGNFTATCTITVENVGTGTLSNPYSVAEILDGTGKGTNYVKGYIIGYVTGTSNNTLVITNTPTSGNNSNWAIADSKGETDESKVISVQIQSSNQTTWGLGNHPDLIGACVKVKGSIENYFSRKGVKSPTDIRAEKTVTVGTTHYATYCATNALDFSNSDVKACKAKISGSSVVLTEVENVPARAGVMLYCETPGEYSIPVIASASALTDNELVGLTAKTAVPWESNGKYNYILQKDDNGNAKFFKATGANLIAYRAYLSTTYDVSATTPSARSLDFVFDDGETTGIADNNRETITNNGSFFDLQGRKVANPTKGLYIVNGKKVVVK